MPALFDPRFVASVVTLLVSAPAWAGQGRVAFHAVVAIDGSVPESAAASMTQAVMDELEAARLEAIMVKDAAAAGVVAPVAASDPAAARQLADGRKALQKLQLGKAVTALEAALAGLAGDDAQSAEAALLLAEAYYRRGDEAKGRKALERLARVAPDTRLDAAIYPPVFVSAFKEVRAQVAKESSSLGAPGPDIRAGIAANRCDPTMRARAIGIARASAADVVVLLGIASGGRLFTVSGFAGDVRTGRWTVLPRLAVDAGMLSANIEGGKLARELAALTTRFVPSAVEGVVPFVETVVAPVAVAPTSAEPAPRDLGPDTALAADLAALDGYPAQAVDASGPLAATTTEVSRDSVFGSWWFWTAVIAGAALAGGATYYFVSRDRPSDTLSLQAAW